MRISIDVVIPSFRLQPEYLIPMLEMEVPEQTKIRYLIIADNPKVEVPEELNQYIDGERVILFRNIENLGASKSRNKGIDNSNADWILFLDDDVVPEKYLLCTYLDAIKNRPDEIGFFGETVFPEPINSYTNGLLYGNILYFFSFARFNDESKCVTTSNILINRKAIGEIRFRDNFPKKGGGEDFAFTLEVFEKTGKTLKSVKNADVYHAWWNNGKRNYKQLFRWSFADYELFRLFPRSTFYDFPNLPELLLIGLLLGITGVLLGLPIYFMFSILLGVLVSEIMVEFVHMLRANNLRVAFYALEVVLLRGAADFGRLCGNMVNFKFLNFLKRPNFSIYEVDYWFRLWSGLKFGGAIILSAFFYLIIWWLF